MAQLDTQEQNFISDLQTWGAAQLALKQKAEELAGRWNQNEMFDRLSAHTTEEIQALFPHLTASEIGNAVNVVNLIVTELGDFSTGQAVNLLKLKG